MKSNYDYALTEVLKSEGGYTNDPRDPGGPTNFGITIGDYRRYVNAKATAVDVRHMKLDEAKKIYKEKYWDALNCDGLPSGVDYTIFDYGVNSGIGRARKILARFQHITDPVTLINAICDERLAFLRSLSTFSVFGIGWTRRVKSVRNESIILSHEPIPMTPVVVAAGTAGAAVATAVTAAAAATTHPHYVPYILGAAGILVLISLIVYMYKRSKHAHS